MVCTAGSRQEHVQNGDVCDEKRDFELYRLVLQMFFLLDAITTTFQTQGIFLLFVFPKKEEYVMGRNGEGNVSQTFLTETYRDLR